MLALGLGIAALVIVPVAVPIAVLIRGSVTQAARDDATAAALTAADFLSRGATPNDVLDAYLRRLMRRTGVQVSIVGPVGDGAVGAPLSHRERDEATERPPIGVDSDHDRDDLRGVFAGPDVVIPGGVMVQVYVPEAQGVSRVLARIDDRAVGARVRQRIEWLAVAALALFAMAGAAAELTSRRLARPLQDVAVTARALQGGDLTARADVGGPKEVADVAGELNALADRIDELLVQERETVADLSHRLRTPLTAVRLSAEALPDSSAKTELEAQIGQLERTLSAVIRSARRPLREGVHGRADAMAVVTERIAFWRPLAEDQGRAVH
jgi:signal transduction histidine kinase